MRIDKKFRRVFNVDALLFLSSLTIYLIYFHPVLFNLNKLLSGITLDTFKNYYTYVYHSTCSASWLNFDGMNYPRGEHPVYTDCQPLLCWLFRPFPFIHPYLIGILNFLMFFSLIITPNILLRIFIRAKMSQWSSAAFALAIGLLSPQFLKIQAGHHALSYACIIPLNILLLQRLMQENRLTDKVFIFLCNLGLYFIHPYFGFSMTLFSLFALLFRGIFPFRLKIIFQNCRTAFVLSILPLLLFRLFMFVSDDRIDRPAEPFGVNLMVENLQSILSPEFGPFRAAPGSWLDKKPEHFERHTYLGMASIVTAIILIVSLIIARRKPQDEPALKPILFSAGILLLISFGYHFDLMNALNLHSSALNQFRATCRFAWYFYYALPVFVLPILFRSFDLITPVKIIFPLVFLALSMFEAHFLFKYHEDAYWHFPNVFSEKHLSAEQKQIIAQMKNSQAQAIIPLPIFHGGSELYDRVGNNNSMTPAMIFSFHCRMPVLSVSLSRTSAKETEDLIETLNAYKKHRDLDTEFTSRNFLILKTNDPLLPDEQRLLSKSHLLARYDSLVLMNIRAADLKKPVFHEQAKIYPYENLKDTNLIFIRNEAREPFSNSNYINTAVILRTDSNQLPKGPQIISLHLHYQRKHFRAVAGDLIIARRHAEGSDWISIIPLRIMSGFYEGFSVFEYEVTLDPNERYEFLIHGRENESYHISDFMIRSSQNDIILKSRTDTISVNNFPMR